MSSTAPGDAGDQRHVAARVALPANQPAGRRVRRHEGVPTLAHVQGRVENEVAGGASSPVAEGTASERTVLRSRAVVQRAADRPAAPGGRSAPCARSKVAVTSPARWSGVSRATAPGARGDRQGTAGSRGSATTDTFASDLGSAEARGRAPVQQTPAQVRVEDRHQLGDCDAQGADQGTPGAFPCARPMMARLTRPLRAQVPQADRLPRVQLPVPPQLRVTVGPVQDGLRRDSADRVERDSVAAVAAMPAAGADAPLQEANPTRTTRQGRAAVRARLTTASSRRSTWRSSATPSPPSPAKAAAGRAQDRGRPKPPRARPRRRTRSRSSSAACATSTACTSRPRRCRCTATS